MFTGLVQGMGKVRALGDDLFAIEIDKNVQDIICADLALGDSVAVDGVCLTVEKIIKGGFVATASPETLNRTILGKNISQNKSINIETSLRVGSKIGGHFVSGHVDGIGCLVEAVNEQKSWEMKFSAPQTLISEWNTYLAPYIVSKGSIAVNGVSLTIADCDSYGSWFTVAVIPVTYAETNLSLLKTGDWVNLESDILGKYVDKLISHRLGSKPKTKEDISIDFLTQHGYQ